MSRDRPSARSRKDVSLRAPRYLVSQLAAVKRDNAKCLRALADLDERLATPLAPAPAKHPPKSVTKP